MVLVVMAGAVMLGQSVQETHEPQWQPALAYGGAPDCSRQLGSRIYRSDIARDPHATIFITGTTVHKAEGCRSTVEISVSQLGETRHLKLATVGKEHVYLVDFSPDGTRVLLAREQREHIDDEVRQYREVSIASMPLASGDIEWHNVWDLFGWRDCDAMVEPQGFLGDGKIVIRARKTVMAGHSHPNCVNDIGLYAVDLKGGLPVRLPDSTTVTRYGRRERPGYQACKSDPDIVGECFKIHGRLSAWNGTPTMRIWRTGTSRILGVQDDIMPEDLTSKMDGEVDAYGDFEVCPFTKERAGEMRMVCIEKAENIFIKKR